MVIPWNERKFCLGILFIFQTSKDYLLDTLIPFLDCSARDCIVAYGTLHARSYYSVLELIGAKSFKILQSDGAVRYNDFELNCQCRLLHFEILFIISTLFTGVAIDPTCINIGTPERTEPNLIHIKWKVTWTHGTQPNRVAVISAKNHKRQRRKRQSVTAKREKSQTPKVLTAILTFPNLT